MSLWTVLLICNFKVNELLKTFDAECKTDTETIEIDDTECEVTTIENLEEVIIKRFQRLADLNKLKPNPSPFENELWLSILGDKGGKSMKLAISFGNQKTPNASDKLLLCGMYDGPSRARMIYAAFKELADKVKN